MVVTMSCLVNRSASMPRLDLQPNGLPEGPGPGIDSGVARNRQFTVYDRSSSNTLNSSGYNTLSRGHRDSSKACFDGCFPHLAHIAGHFRHSNSAIDVRRQPINVLNSKGFWNGISELRSVLTPGNPLLETQNSGATFYVVNPSRDQSYKLISP